MARLFLLFTLLPLLELFILVKIGGQIGFLPTLLGVIVVGAIGASLARREGFRVLREWQSALAQGRMPDEGVLGGMLVLVGGVLLIAPGVLSDVVGLALLFPPTRKLVAGVLGRRLERSIAEGTVHVYGVPGMGGGPFGASPGPRYEGPSVIDVEGIDVTAATRDDGKPRLR